MGVPDRRTDHTPTHPRPTLTRVDAYEDVITSIVRALHGVRSRHRTGTIPAATGTAFLMEVERQLSALVAVGYVPPEPDPRRPRLTS